MIGQDTDNNDVHIVLEHDVEILQGENLIVFMNSNQEKDGNGRVILRINNKDDLDRLAKGVIDTRKYLNKMERKKKKEQYVKFSGQTQFSIQKPESPHQ
jgi:DNA-binding cell septation regulator SpoVG